MFAAVLPIFLIYLAVAIVVAVIGLLRGWGRRALWVGLWWAYYLKKADLDGWRDTRIK